MLSWQYSTSTDVEFYSVHVNLFLKKHKNTKMQPQDQCIVHIQLLGFVKRRYINSRNYNTTSAITPQSVPVLTLYAALFYLAEFAQFVIAELIVT